MKVICAKSYLFYPGNRKNWLFVKVETDEGITGWGECYTHLDRDYNIMKVVEELERYLIGRDPFNIKSFTYFAYVDFAKKRGSLELFAAVSGIEMALWDIVGKALHTPAYRLMGGTCREKLRIYANGWHYKAASLVELAESALQTVAKGFTALKIDPLPEEWTMFLSREDEKYAIDRIRAIRSAVGPEIDLLMDLHRRLAPYDTLRLAERLEKFGLFWYEEPVSCKNMEMLASVKAQLKMRVVTGEELYTKAEFRRAFELGAADVINPDLCNCGGMLELKEIAAMAEVYYISIAPHNCNSSYLATAAMAHTCAAMPNFLIAEYFLNLEDARLALAKEPLTVKDGYLYLPDRPGLGVEIDEEFLLKNPYKQAVKRTMHEMFS